MPHIVETIVTTKNAKGEVHIAPLGLIAEGVTVAAFVEVDAAKIGQRIHGAPVVAVEQARSFVGPLHLAAVGRSGARERIRAVARGLGLTDGEDLVAVA